MEESAWAERERVVPSSFSSDPLEGDLVFQAVSWYGGDEEVDDDGSDSDEESPKGAPGAQEKKARKRYAIRVFGVTAEGASVGLSVTGYTPFFFVKVPTVRGVGPADAASRVATFIEGLGKKDANLEIVAARVMWKKDFWGFTNGKEFAFVRVVCNSHTGAKWTARRLRGKLVVTGLGNVTFALYEANIDPLLRFFHLNEVLPAGWLRVAGYDGGGGSGCQIDVTSKWKAVKPEPRDETAPLVMASFDLECNSSHGDFPVAVKDYRKLGVELEQAWEREKGGLRSLSEYDAVNAVYELLRIAFAAAPLPQYSAASLLHLKSAKKGVPSDVTLRHMADDIAAILRSGAVQGSGAGDRLARLVGFLNLEFGKSWPLKGDEIIQIGTTVNVYGAPVSQRYVFTLGSCEDVAGADVRVFESEKAMLAAWLELVRSLDPDVIMGYNIFGCVSF